MKDSNNNSNNDNNNSSRLSDDDKSLILYIAGSSFLKMIGRIHSYDVFNSEAKNKIINLVYSHLTITKEQVRERHPHALKVSIIKARMPMR